MKLPEYKGVCIYAPVKEVAGGGAVQRGLAASNVRYSNDPDCPPGKAVQTNRKDAAGGVPNAKARHLWMESSIEEIAGLPGMAVCNPEGLVELFGRRNIVEPGMYLVPVDGATRPVGIVRIGEERGIRPGDDVQDVVRFVRSVLRPALSSGAASFILVRKTEGLAPRETDDAGKFTTRAAMVEGASFDTPMRDLVVMGSDAAVSYQDYIKSISGEVEEVAGRKIPDEIKGRGKPKAPLLEF